MDESEETDILMEALEVTLHQILYLRKIYPRQVYKMGTAYNAPVFVSIFPRFTKYVQQILKMAKELRSEGKLERIDLIIFKNQDESKMLERYVFDIVKLPEDLATSIEDDEFLLGFEEQMRNSLYAMAQRLKGLPDLCKNVEYKILLHTTEVGYVKASSQPKNQEFQWMRYDLQKSDTNKANAYSILPLTSFNLIGLQMLVEVNPKPD